MTIRLCEGALSSANFPSVHNCRSFLCRVYCNCMWFNCKPFPVAVSLQSEPVGLPAPGHFYSTSANSHTHTCRHTLVHTNTALKLIASCYTSVWENVHWHVVFTCKRVMNAVRGVQLQEQRRGRPSLLRSVQSLKPHWPFHFLTRILSISYGSWARGPNELNYTMKNRGRSSVSKRRGHIGI